MRTRFRNLAALTAVCALGATAPFIASRAGAAGGDPVSFRPAEGRQGVAVEIPRGKELLFLFLQRLADFTGEPTYFVGETAPDATITIARDVGQLDFDAADKVLRAAGFQLSRQSYRQKRVLWVERRLVPPGTTGKLTRRGEGEPEPEPARSSTTDAAPGVSLFERRDGAGTRFLVTYETSSREDADDLLLLIEAFQKKRIGH